MTFMGAILGLTIESTSPDAYCPPVSEVRNAVTARVGAVTGEEFQARYGLVRDATTGRTIVSLSLRDSNDREVLHREIPVTDAGCSDAALAIAVVLERYFSGVIRPSTETPEPSSETKSDDESEEEIVREPAEVTEAADTPPPPAQNNAEGVEAPNFSPHRSFLRGTIALGDVPAPAVHLTFGHAFNRWGALFTELSTWPLLTTVQQHPYETKMWFWALGFGVEARTRLSQRLEAAIAPQVGAALQGARVAGANVSAERLQTRMAPSLGAALRLGYRLSDRIGLGAQVHGIALLGGKRFVVQEGAVRHEVLDLPSGRGDAGLYFSYSF